MTRDEFLQALRRELSPLSPEERDAAVNYYEEFLADAEDEGVAIEKLGSPQLIAQRILQENGVAVPVQTPERAPAAKTPYYKSVWFWLCVVLTLPVTLPVALGLAAAAIAIVAGLGITALALIVAFYAAMAALTVAGVFLCVWSFPCLHLSIPLFVMLLGFGVCMVGLGVLTGLGTVSACVGLSRCIRNARKKKREARAAKAALKKGGDPA